MVKLSQLWGESILNCRDGSEQGPGEEEEPLASASHPELGELLQGYASQPTRVIVCVGDSWLCLAVFHTWYHVGSAFTLPGAQTKGLKDNRQEIFHL